MAERRITREEVERELDWVDPEAWAELECLNLATTLRDVYAELAVLEERLAAGITQAVAARGSGASVLMALQGDPGAVVEADPYGRKP